MSFIFSIKVRGVSEFADLRTVTGDYPVLGQARFNSQWWKDVDFRKIS